MLMLCMFLFVTVNNRITMDADKEIGFEQLHEATVTCAATSADGDLLVTGNGYRAGVHKLCWNSFIVLVMMRLRFQRSISTCVVDAMQWISCRIVDRSTVCL